MALYLSSHFGCRSVSAPSCMPHPGASNGSRAGEVHGAIVRVSPAGYWHACTTDCSAAGASDTPMWLAPGTTVTVAGTPAAANSGAN